MTQGVPVDGATPADGLAKCSEAANVRPAVRQDDKTACALLQESR